MKTRIVAWLVAFLVIFNLGYVFHEIIVHDFMIERIGAITRSSYRIDQALFARICDGKIAELWEIVDTETLQRQLAV